MSFMIFLCSGFWLMFLLWSRGGCCKCVNLSIILSMIHVLTNCIESGQHPKHNVKPSLVPSVPKVNGDIYIYKWVRDHGFLTSSVHSNNY